MKQIALICLSLLWFSMFLFGEGNAKYGDKRLENPQTLPVKPGTLEEKYTLHQETVPEKKSTDSEQATPLPHLVILPFTGVNSVLGEHIGLMLSNLPEIQSTFTVSVPLTNDIYTAVKNPQAVLTTGVTTAPKNKQYSVMTRPSLVLSDTGIVSAIGNQFNADFVITGYVRELENRNLLLINLIKMDNFQQIAGDYREFNTIGDIRELLPDMVNKMVYTAKTDTSPRPLLAIVPFTVAEESLSVQDTEILAQLLTIEIINSGRYVVLSRQKTIETTSAAATGSSFKNLNIKNIKAIGNATKAQYVLVGNIIRFRERSNLFLTYIFNTEDETLQADGEMEYKTIIDGIKSIPDMASTLIQRVQNP